MKVCGKCGAEKALVEFAFKNKKKGTLNSYCKVCNRQYQKSHYQNNKSDYLTTARERRKESEDYVRGYRSKLSCVDCGEAHPAVLDFHHVDPSLKRFNIGGQARNYGLACVREELKKCICLCSNCHRKRHWNERHGPIV